MRNWQVSWAAALVWAALVAWSGLPGRVLDRGDSETLVGGEPTKICANQPTNSTVQCDGKVQQASDGGWYKCVGTPSLDQYCPAADSNNSKVCNDGSAQCTGGSQYTLTSGNVWLFIGYNCTKNTYANPTQASGSCQVGSG